MAVGWKTQRRVNGGAAGTPLSLAQRIIHALPMRKRLLVIYCTNQARALYRGSFSPPPLPLPGKSITCQKTDRQSKCEVLGWHVFRRVCEGIIKRRDGRRVSQILVCALHADGSDPGGMLLFFFVEHLYNDLEMIVPDACWIFRFLKLAGAVRPRVQGRFGMFWNHRCVSDLMHKCYLMLTDALNDDYPWQFIYRNACHLLFGVICNTLVWS